MNRKGKREGLFKPGDTVIELPAELWSAFGGRHRHGDVSDLRKGDLVWLEPKDPTCAEIKTADDVGSIQWARWGRRGESLLEIIRGRHPAVLPDCLNPDGLVDEVTDLFGQVPSAGLEGKAAGPFAARVRPENLVFRDAHNRVERGVVLAPLAPPHPGCAAFYRDEENLDRVRNEGSGLRGYKVYRVSVDGDHPWLFKEQGVYKESGQLDHPQQRVNKTCDLLKEGVEGSLRIAIRALSTRELSLLLAACSVDWRLGGGKPLGLGLCRVIRVGLIAEDGSRHSIMDRPGPEEARIEEPYRGEIAKDGDLVRTMATWQATQRPVRRVRYPRAVSTNQKRIQRGGHAWFQQHAQPRKVGDEKPMGLQVTWTAGPLKDAVGADRIKAQSLPRFDPNDPEAGELYGYDCIIPEEAREKARNLQTLVSAIEPFDPTKHVRGDERSGGPQSQNRDSRQRDRRDPRR